MMLDTFTMFPRLVAMAALVLAMSSEIFLTVAYFDSKEFCFSNGCIFDAKPKTNLPVQLAVELQFYQHCPERHHQYWSLYQYCN